MKRCTVEFHEALKVDIVKWLALEYVGIQKFDDDDSEALEIRNCTCGSSLCKEIKL